MSDCYQPYDISCTVGSNGVYFYFYHGKRISGSVALASGLRIGPCMSVSEKRKKTGCSIASCNLAVNNIMKQLGSQKTIVAGPSISDLQMKLDKQMKENMALQRDLSRTDESLKIAQTQLEELYLLQADTGELKTLFIDCQHNMELCNHELREARAEMIAIKTRLTTCETDRDTCLNKLAEQMRLTEANKIQTKNCEDQLKLIQSQYDKSRQEISLLQNAQIQSAKKVSANQEAQQIIQSLTSQLKMKDAQIASAQKTAMESTDKMGAAKYLVDGLQTQIISLIANFSGCKKKYQELKNAADEAAHTSEQLIKVVKGELINNRQTMSKQMQELSIAQAEIQRLKEGSNDLKRCQADAARCTAEISNRANIIIQLENKVKELTVRFDDTRQQLNTCQSTSSSSRLALSQKLDQCNSSVTECKQALSKCGVTEQQLQTVSEQLILKTKESEDQARLLYAARVTIEATEKIANELRSKLQASESILADRDTQVAEISRRLTEMNQGNRGNKEPDTKLASIIQEWTNKYNQVVSSLRSCENKLAPSVTALGVCMQKLEECETTSKTLADQSQVISNLRQQLASQTVDLTEQTKKLYSSNTKALRAESMDNEYQSMKHQLLSAKTELASITASLTQAELRIEELEKLPSITQAGKSMYVAKSRATVLEKDLADCRGTASNCESIRKQIAQDLQACQKGLSDLKGQITQCESEGLSKNSQIASMQKQISTIQGLESTISQLRNETETQTVALKKLQADKDAELATLKTACRQQLDKRRDEKYVSVAEASDLKKQLTNLQQVSSQLVECQKSLETISVENKRYSDHIDYLEKQNVSLTEQVRNISIDVNKLQAIQSRLDAIVKQNDECQLKLSHNRDAVANRDKLIQDIQQRLRMSEEKAINFEHLRAASARVAKNQEIALDKLQNELGTCRERLTDCNKRLRSSVFSTY